MNTFGGLSEDMLELIVSGMRQFSVQETLGAPLCYARAFGRMEIICLFRFPALAPQRDPRLGGRAGLLSIVPVGTLDTRRLAGCQSFYFCAESVRNKALRLQHSAVS